MKLLILDTATEACSVALQWGERVISRFDICPQQHSQRLLPMVDEVLHEGGMALAELDYLGFGRGPGSFTGVRIATGMLQGLAFGADKPVIGVSTLAAMAQQAIDTHGAEYVCAAIDARMGELYLGHFKNQGGLATPVTEEQVVPPEILSQQLHELALSEVKGVGTGWKAYADLASKCDVDVLDDIQLPSATFMLPLARRDIASGLAVSADKAQPSYVRDKVTWKKLPGRE